MLFGNEWWGEVDVIKHCEKRLLLKWRSFRERCNFLKIWFWDLRFRIWGLKIKHLKAHNFGWQGIFSFIIISQLCRPIEIKYSQVCYFMHMLRYTEWEDWSLTITNSVQGLQRVLLLLQIKFWPWPESLLTVDYTCRSFSFISHKLVEEKIQSAMCSGGSC